MVYFVTITNYNKFVSIQSIYEQALEADVSGVALKSSLQRAIKLSEIYENSIFMKREDTQSVFSFKCRGAYNKIRQLSNRQKSAGIIAASAGNHAQGVALSAYQLSLDATIIMPVTTPSIKVDAVSNLGAKVILFGDSYDDAYDYALKLSESEGSTFIHPYDDPQVIAGQATIALEILDQLSEPIDYLFVAVGGGGLLAGVLSVFKTISPSTVIVAVEPENSDCLAAALRENKRVILDSVGIFADGVAVKQIGEQTFNLIQPHLDDSVLVSIDDICAAIKDIYEETRSIVEPAGALSLAGMKQYIKDKSIKDKNIVTINCGANMNFDRLRHVAERTEIGEEKEALYVVRIPEAPGSLKSFCSVIGKRTITEFNYRYQSKKDAMIFVGFSIQDISDSNELIQIINNNGYSATDLTKNELAKLHIRHMIGGTPHESLMNERIFRCQFPERPGALMEFLNKLLSQWNISLFHYRNHGAAYGRVLVGLEVPISDNEKLDQMTQSIGFNFIEETDNPSYSLLLK